MKLLRNTRYCFNFYKTSKTTSLMLYCRLTNSEMMSRDNVQSTVNIIFLMLLFYVTFLCFYVTFLWIPVKELFDIRIY